jgi:hypothetical protein
MLQFSQRLASQNRSKLHKIVRNVGVSAVADFDKTPDLAAKQDEDHER